MINARIRSTSDINLLEKLAVCFVPNFLDLLIREDNCWKFSTPSWVWKGYLKSVFFILALTAKSLAEEEKQSSGMNKT